MCKGIKKDVAVFDRMKDICFFYLFFEKTEVQFVYKLVDNVEK